MTRWKSPSKPTKAHHMMLWNYDSANGRYYGAYEEFCYDKATSIPIVPQFLTVKYGMPCRKIDEAIVMSMGFANTQFQAWHFCHAHITLPGSNEARIIPMSVYDALDLKVMLIPISLATGNMISEYLNDHFDDLDDEDNDTPIVMDICRFKPCSYSSTVVDNLPCLSPVTVDSDSEDEEDFNAIQVYNPDHVVRLTLRSDGPRDSVITNSTNPTTPRIVAMEDTSLSSEFGTFHCQEETEHITLVGIPPSLRDTLGDNQLEWHEQSTYLVSWNRPSHR